MAENMTPNELEEVLGTPDLYTLVDEEGNEQLFEEIDEMEENGKLYMALIPHVTDPQELLAGPVELVVLVAATDDEGNEILAPLESDEEYDRIAQIFIDRLEADEDEDDDETEA